MGSFACRSRLCAKNGIGRNSLGAAGKAGPTACDRSRAAFRGLGSSVVVRGVLQVFCGGGGGGVFDCPKSCAEPVILDGWCGCLGRLMGCFDRLRSKHPDACSGVLSVFPMIEFKHPRIQASGIRGAQKVARDSSQRGWFLRGLVPFLPSLFPGEVARVSGRCVWGGGWGGKMREGRWRGGLMGGGSGGRSIRQGEWERGYSVLGGRWHWGGRRSLT